MSDRENGEVPGWDAAGVVIRAARDADGGLAHGPAPGEPVVTYGAEGAWAARRVVSTDQLAVLPPGVGMASAAALPVAGLAALRGVRRLGPVLGRHVLVTGASGGVGRLAVQLARLAGARVTASVGGAVRGEGLRDLGADEVVTSVDGVTEPIDGVIDNVGGPQLAQIVARLAVGGTVLCVGTVRQLRRGRRTERDGATWLDGADHVSVVDVADPAAPQLLSVFPPPATPPGASYADFRERPGWSGPHNQNQLHHTPDVAPQDDLVYLSYFNAGLRIYDIGELRRPKEVAWFLPPDPRERRGPPPSTDLVVQSEDVLVDRRGYTFLSDKNQGIWIVRAELRKPRKDMTKFHLAHVEPAWRAPPAHG